MEETMDITAEGRRQPGLIVNVTFVIQIAVNTIPNRLNGI